MEAVVRDTNENEGDKLRYVFLPPAFEDDSDTSGDEKPTAERNETGMGKATKLLKEPADNKDSCSKGLPRAAASKKPSESHVTDGREEDTSHKEEVSDVIPLEPARKIPKIDSQKAATRKTAPVYTVDDDSDEEKETREDKKAETSTQAKGGRGARKRNHTEMKPNTGGKDPQKSGVERKKSPRAGIRKDLDATIQSVTATSKTVSLSSCDPSASCPEDISMKSSEVVVNDDKDAEGTKQSEGTKRISKPVTPGKPSSIPCDESDSNDVMEEEKGLEYYLGSKVIKLDRRQSSSGRSKVSAPAAPKSKRETKQKSANDPDVLLLAAKTPTPHPVNSEVLASASLPLKELITKYKTKAGCGLPRIPIEICDKPTLMLFINKLNKSAVVTFEEGKKLLGPSTKYVVEDLASRCISSLIGEINEENCLELKLLALEANNKEFNRLVDEKIETQVLSPDPLILKSEFLKQLAMDKLVTLISRRNTNLTMECIHKLTNAWLAHEDRGANMNLFTQIKALELIRCDATFDPTVFDGMPGSLPVFQSGIPGWVFLKSLVTPRKFDKSMESVVSSRFKSPTAVKLIEPQVSMAELIGKRKRAMEEAEALPKHLASPAPSLGSTFKIPKLIRSTSSTSVSSISSSAHHHHTDRSPSTKQDHSGSGYHGNVRQPSGDNSGRSGKSARSFENSGAFQIQNIKSEAESEDWDAPEASSTNAFPVRGSSCDRFVASNGEADSRSRPTGVYGNSRRNGVHSDYNSSRQLGEPSFPKTENNELDGDWGSGSFRSGNSTQCHCSSKASHWSQKDGNSENNPSYAVKGEMAYKNSNSSISSQPEWDDWGNGSGRSNTSRPTNVSSSPGFGSSSFNGRENRSSDRETNDFRRGGRGGGRGGRGGGRVPRDDDWACSCGFPSNFGSRNTCFKCQQPRPGGSSGGSSGYRGRDGGRGGRGGRGGGRGGRGNSYDTPRNSGAGSWDDFGSNAGSSGSAAVTKATDDDDDWDAPPKNTAVVMASSSGTPSQKMDDWDSPSSANMSVNKGAPTHLPSSKVVVDDDWDTPTTVNTSYNPTASFSQNQESKELKNTGNTLTSRPADTAAHVAKGSGEDEWGDTAGTQESRLSTLEAPGNIPSVESKNSSSKSNLEEGTAGNWEQSNVSHGGVSNVDQGAVSCVEDVGERINHSLTGKSSGTSIGICSLNTGAAERDSDWNGVTNSKEKKSAEEVQTAMSSSSFDVSASCDPRLQRRKSSSGSEVGASPCDKGPMRSEAPTGKGGGNGLEWTLSPIAGASNQVVRSVRPENPIRTEPARIIDADKSLRSNEEDEWA